MPLLLQIIIYTTLISYAVGAGLYFFGAMLVKEKVLKAAFILALAGCVFNLLALIIRTIIAGRLPLSSGYEFVLSFTFITAALFLLYEIKNNAKSGGGPVMLIAAALILSVVIMMKGQFGEVSPLMPALKSSWLTIHVLTAAAAYAAFALAANNKIIARENQQQEAEKKYIIYQDAATLRGDAKNFVSTSRKSKH